MNVEVIEVECYEGGRWVIRRYPRPVAVSLFQQLGEALGVHEPVQPAELREGNLKVLVD